MKVLVVDDEKDMQLLLGQRFRREIKDKKIDFAFANSGPEALGYLAQSGSFNSFQHQYARYEWP